MRFRVWFRLAAALLCAWLAAPAAAIPPDTPFTNVAQATYQVDGAAYTASGSITLFTDANAANSPPYAIELPAPPVVAEGVPGAPVGVLTVLDLDPGDVHTFTVSDPRFVVDGDTLRLADGVSLDFETEPTVTVIVDAVDPAGASVSQSFTVTVTDQNEPPVSLALDSLSLAAGTAGAPVGTLTVVDPDVADTFTFVVDDARFEVVGGVLKLTDAERLTLGTTVTLNVTATDSGGEAITASFTVTATPPGGGAGDDPTVTLLRYAPTDPDAAAATVAPAFCDAGSGAVPQPAAVDAFGAPVPTGAPLPLVNAPLKAGESLFVRVFAVAANVDPTLAEQIDVRFDAGAGTDSELITLNESDVNTGIFTGHVVTAGAPAAPGNCVLEVRVSETVTATYAVGASEFTGRGVFDPVSRVFDSATGRAIDGAQLQLVTADGAPAAVFADDGSPASGTAVSGMLATADGAVDGAFRLPLVAAGTLQLLVSPPNRFAFPSVAADGDLQQLPGAPWELSDASRGVAFDLLTAGPALIDVPLDLLPITPTTSVLRTLRAVPSGDAPPRVVTGSQCLNAGSPVDSGTPVTLALGPQALPATLPLTPAGRVQRGDAVFVELTDADQDLDPFAPDTVTVVVAGADAETLTLFETGASTGVFTGFVQTAAAPPVSGNCVLEGASASAFVFRYSDAGDPQDTASADVLLDPGFTVFSSADGGLLDGAEVTLLDAVTGLPAQVFSSDGVTPFPATVTSGGSVQDAAGTPFDFAPGTFAWPTIPPGAYRLAVTPPIAHTFPSVADDAALNALAAGPYVLNDGSRGGEFTVVAGVPVAFDLPLDPVAVEVFVTKQASKDAVAVGDFLQYQVTVSNGDAQEAVAAVEMVDRLPPGFRYAVGSLQVNRQRTPDPRVGSDGRELIVPVGDLGPGDEVEVRYVVEVSAGARQGMARNEATARGVGIAGANVAFADTVVREDLLRSHAIIVGQVWEVADETCALDDAAGLAGARVWLETGSFVVADPVGKFHFAAVEPGTHVVQLDEAAVPAHLEPVRCEDTTATGGNALSQFVDVAGGGIWRVDFFVKPKAPDQRVLTTRLDGQAQPEAGTVTYNYQLRLAQTEFGLTLEKVRATIMLDEQLAYVPGSATLDGQVLGDPSGIELNALTFKLPELEVPAGQDEMLEAHWQLRFAARVRPEVLREAAGSFAPTPMLSKGIVALHTPAGKVRTPVAENELSLVWPASLMTVADSRVSAAEAGAGPAGSGEVRIVSGVHEPSIGDNRARSRAQKTLLSVALAEDEQIPYRLPALDRGEAPEFDTAWIEAHQHAPGVVWPPARFNPVIPAIPVAVLHGSKLRPQLLVDGELVNPLTYEGTVAHHELGLTLSIWSGVPISESDSLIDVRLLDSGGETVQTYARSVHFSSGAARAEFVPEASHLVADGLTPPVVAVKLYDRAGYPVRAGSTGEFAVSAPYAPLDKTRHLENLSNEFDNLRYRVLRDGVAYIQLEPTTSAGEVSLHFQFDQVRRETIRARLVPGARDWILVGLAEGSWASATLEGALAPRGNVTESITDGRIAFYAKGAVRGDWLLTAAYDTDKAFERSLREQIDPNQFYTLYGDGSSQRFDAQSQQKLYLKVERARLSAVAGDFDTELNRAELTRYDRRLNGVNVGWFGESVELRAFASETDQAFVRDELRGDGTSGVYRLSRQPLVRYSEQVRLVTRDRFRTEVIVAETALNRFADYTIDYDRGTLIFKQPVFSQDENFNPIYIEVEYEVAPEAADEEIVAGLRAAYRLDAQDSEVALIHVDDGTTGQGGTMTGLDVTWQLDARHKLTVEAARTDTDRAWNADAYLVELERTAENLAGRVYFREQEGGYGLGHQASIEQGTRKAGMEGELRLNQHTILGAQLFRQEVLADGTRRLVLNAQAEHQRWGAHLTAGLRGVEEDGEGGDARTAQATLGASRSFLGSRLVLRSDAELDLLDDDVADYPTRAILGAEYKLPRNVRLFLEQELSWSEARDTQDTRFGVRSRPWNGADISTMVQREQGEDGERVFATTGLLQQFRLTDAWLIDVGMDRVQTLTQRGEAAQPAFNSAVPPTVGSLNNDFSAAFFGVGYQQDNWHATSRLEFHQGDVSDKWNLALGANRQLSEGRVVSTSAALLKEELDGGAVNDSADIRFALAWRPRESAWTFLQRTDLVLDERRSATFDTRARKWVTNLGANFKPNATHQASLQLAGKYVVEQFDGQEFDSVTLLMGGEYRYNVSPRFDLGVRGSVLKSFGADTLERSWGLSAGMRVLGDSWLSVGYNFEGFDDDDFVAAEYSVEGPYVKLRMKFDQSLLRRFLAPAGSDRGARPRVE